MRISASNHSKRPNGAYAHTSNGTLELDFTGENPNVGNPSGGEIAGGQGINRNAISTFRDVFTVTNQGTQEVTIGILGAEAELLSPMGVAEAPPTDPFLFLFWSVGLGFKEFDDMLVAYAILPTDLFDELLGGFGGPVTPMDAPGEPPIGGPVILGPGEEQSYSVITVAADDLPEMANEVGANQLQSDLNGVDPVLEDEITFMAVADLEDQFPIGGESV